MKKKKSKKIALFYRFNINLLSYRQNFILFDNEAVKVKFLGEGKDVPVDGNRLFRMTRVKFRMARTTSFLIFCTTNQHSKRLIFK